MWWAVSQVFLVARGVEGVPMRLRMPKPGRRGSRITVEREGRPLLRPKACFDRRAA